MIPPSPGDRRSGPDPGSYRRTIELAYSDAPPVRLLYVEEGPTVYVRPTRDAGAWFSGAMREGQVELAWPDGARGRRLVRLVEPGPRTAFVRALFEEKYGTQTCLRYFDGSDSALALIAPEDGWIPSGRTDVERIRGEFDAAADFYDARVSAHPIDVYLKDRVSAFAEAAFEDRDPLLEIGPGTGYHTRRLLAAGHRVVAVDLSGGMLRRLRSSAEGAAWASRLELREGPVVELARVLSDLPDGYFAGMFSAFGALDLEPEVRAIASALARLIRPAGRLAFTSLNRPGWTPLLWELARGRPRAAAARTLRTIPPGRIEYPLALYPRQPSDWDGVLSPAFAREDVRGISTLSPPFDPRRLLRSIGSRGSRRLRRWDQWISDRPVSWPASEWLFLTYRRVGSPVPQVAPGE